MEIRKRETKMGQNSEKSSKGFSTGKMNCDALLMLNLLF